MYKRIVALGNDVRIDISYYRLCELDKKERIRELVESNLGILNLMLFQGNSTFNTISRDLMNDDKCLN